MNWIECKKHPSIYYDSSVYERCPSCVNEVLGTALFKWAMVDMENLFFENALLKWHELSLHAMNRALTQQEKAKSDVEADTAYAKTREIQKTITAEYTELVGYIMREGVLPFLPRNELGRLAKRIDEFCSS